MQTQTLLLSHSLSNSCVRFFNITECSPVDVRQQIRALDFCLASILKRLLIMHIDACMQCAIVHTGMRRLYPDFSCSFSCCEYASQHRTKKTQISHRQKEYTIEALLHDCTYCTYCTWNRLCSCVCVAEMC